MHVFDFSRRANAALDGRRRRAAHALSLVVALCLAGAAVAERQPQSTGKPGGASCLPDQVHTGQLQVLGDDGTPQSALPLRHTDVSSRVSGSIAQVTVEQRFENPYAQSIEAVYTFPLPHEAAVNAMSIKIGERIVRGEVRKRQEAREIYEQAKRDGRAAALLDQERPNIFTQSIANIMPGHEIVVRIDYVEELVYKDGAYELVFPTVVGPRFIPGTPLEAPVTPAGATGEGGVGADNRPIFRPVPPSGIGWAPDTDRVPDASRITPPVLPPGARSGHDIGISVELDTGVPLERVHSENHAVDVVRHARSRATVALKPTDTIPNKDFILRFEVAGRGPEFGWLTYRDPSESPNGYFSFVLQPEAEVTADEARPKEMIFLIDASGSMSGEPMAKVKAAMRWALQNMNPEDTFQVIRFSERASPLAARPLTNTPDHVQRALTYIEQLRGQGGTHMRAGIEAALRTPPDAERLRLVFFMTDGYIGNEAEILRTVRAMIGDARIFSFGVGSSVNRYLLDRVAREGRGVADYVSLHADTRDVVERFYARIAKPYLTDIEIDWGSLVVEDLAPERLPDLFAGQPLVVSGRYREPARGTITVRGKLGRGDFERRLRVTLPKRAPEHDEIAVLWARRQIAALMSRMVRGEREELVREVTDLALRFQLVSQYTSFVAADNQVVNVDGKTMLVSQPVLMPEGVRHEAVFPETAALGIPPAPMSAARALRPGAGAPAPRSVVHRMALAPPVEILASSPLRETSQSKVETGAQVEGMSGDAAIAKKDADTRPESGDLPTLLPQGPGFELVAHAKKTSVALGEKVQVQLTVHNRGTTFLELPVTLDVRDGSLLARVELNGAALPAPRRWQATPAPAPAVRLAPGDSHTWTVTLTGEGRYAFAVAGRYAIELVVPALGAGVARCLLEVR